MPGSMATERICSHATRVECNGDEMAPGTETLDGATG